MKLYAIGAVRHDGKQLSHGEVINVEDDDAATKLVDGGVFSKTKPDDLDPSASNDAGAVRVAGPVLQPPGIVHKPPVDVPVTQPPAALPPSAQEADEAARDARSSPASKTAARPGPR